MNCVRVSSILRSVEQDKFETLYRDQRMIRSKHVKLFEDGSAYEIVVECFREYSAYGFHFTQATQPSGPVQVILDLLGASVVQGKQTHFYRASQYFVWISDYYHLIERRDDGGVSVLDEYRLVLQNETQETCFVIPENPEKTICFSFFIFTEDPFLFQEQINTLSEVETRTVSRGRWLKYAKLSDIWNYFINGRFFNRIETRSFESQLIPYTLYYYFVFLYEQTQKKIYLFLRDMVAYVLLLSLPDDSVWKHNIWGDGDIHFAHVVSGADVLLHHYQVSGCSLFLEKVTSILDYCVSVSDTCEADTRWFLHDSFEIPGRHEQTYYTDVNPSRAFGKTQENTLTLNTHVLTLIMLKKYHCVTLNSRYVNDFERGQKLLYDVLDARPASFGYGLVYGIRDLLLNIFVREHKSYLPSALRYYDRKVAGPLLRWLKLHYPRINMPNGFIERDLTFTCLSEFYFLINMEQLLMLNRLAPCKIIQELVGRSVRYAIQSKMFVHYAHTNFLAHTFLGVLLQYGTTVNPDYLRDLGQFIVFLRRKGYSLPVKVIASPEISNIHSCLKSSNPAVLLLVGDASLDTIGIAVNLSDCRQNFRIDVSDQKSYCLERWDGTRTSAFMDTVVEAYSSLKIMEVQ